MISWSFIFELPFPEITFISEIVSPSLPPFLCFFLLFFNSYHLLSARNLLSSECINGERGTLLHCWWECKLVQPLWRTVWRFLKKLKIELPYDPAIALLSIYPKDTDVVKRRAICTPMLIVAMSTVAKLWKEPRCPSTDK